MRIFNNYFTYFDLVDGHGDEPASRSLLFKVIAVGYPSYFQVVFDIGIYLRTKRDHSNIAGRFVRNRIIFNIAPTRRIYSYKMFFFWCGMLIFCIGYVQNKIINPFVNEISDPNFDIFANSMQLITKYGNNPQSHAVISEDGYIVNVFRIPGKGPPVLLVHGVGDSSDSWLVTDRASSLAYQLSDLGFDIWLYNTRGNKYSQKHVRKLPDRQYWDFSFEEMGSRDLPAAIDYILSLTDKQKLYYIGFSQGTTVFLVMGSLRPEYNAKIQHAVLLAPVAWVSHLQYPFIALLANNSNLLKTFLDGIGVYKVFENNLLLQLYHTKACRDGVPENVFCEFEFALSFGIKNLTFLNIERLPVIAAHINAGVSTETFVHYFHNYKSGRFQRRDYGAKRNLDTYGSRQPPEFDVSAVTAPISMFTSEIDWFSTVEDMKNLRRLLPNIVNDIHFNKSLEFSHLEFVYGARVKSLVNDPVIDILLGDLYQKSAES